MEKNLNEMYLHTGGRVRVRSIGILYTPTGEHGHEHTHYIMSVVSVCMVQYICEMEWSGVGHRIGGLFACLCQPVCKCVRVMRVDGGRT